MKLITKHMLRPTPQDETPHWVVVALNLLSRVLKNQEALMTEMENLKAQVDINTTVVGSTIALLHGIAARITAAGTDSAQLARLTADLTTQDEALSAAVAANTPGNVVPNVTPAAVLAPNVTPIVYADGATGLNVLPRLAPSPNVGPLVGNADTVYPTDVGPGVSGPFVPPPGAGAIFISTPGATGPFAPTGTPSPVWTGVTGPTLPPLFPPLPL